MDDKVICPQCQRQCASKRGLTLHLKKCKTSLPEATSKLEDSISLPSSDQPINLELTTRYFKSFYDILRSEGIASFTAYQNLLPIIGLRCLESYFKNSFYTFQFPSDFEDDAQEHQDIVMEGVKYRCLSQIPMNTDMDISKIPEIIKHVMIMLFFHKKLHHIFPKYDILTIKHPQTYKKLITKLIELPIEKIQGDVLGDTYEWLISQEFKGKTLGQYFTPYWIRKYIIKVLNPQLLNDGTFPTMIDPASGTGGFNVMYLRYLMEQEKDKKLKINWDFAREKGINGVEIDPSTLSAGNINLMLTTGHLFPEYKLGDSLTLLHDHQFNMLASNPPFGIKGIKWNNHANTSILCPIKTNDGTALFLQCIVSLLKPSKVEDGKIVEVGGSGGFVFPTGKEFFGKEESLSGIRRMILQSCWIQSIIYLPKGVFDNAKGIGTCLIFLTKYRDVGSFLKTSETRAKQHLNFLDENFPTQEINYYEIKEIPKDKEDPILTPLGKITLEKLKENDWCFDYNKYEQKIVKSLDNLKISCQRMKLGDICEIETGKFNSGDMDNRGNIPFYNCSAKNPIGTHSICSFDYPEYILLICSGGSENNKMGENVGLGKVFYVSGKTACRGGVRCLCVKNQSLILSKFLYYYLMFNREDITKYAQFTTSLGVISLEYVKDVEILIPSIKNQENIIKFLDEKIPYYEKRIERRKQDLEDYEEDKKEVFRNVRGNRVKISDIVKINENIPKHETSYNNENGKYIFYTGSKDMIYYTDTPDINFPIIIINRTNGAGRCNIFYSEKCSVANQTIVFYNHEKITTKYIYYYYLVNINLLENGYKGANHKNIAIEDFKETEIIIPSLEEQKKLVEKMDIWLEKVEKRIEEAKVEIEELEKRKNNLMKELLEL